MDLVATLKHVPVDLGQGSLRSTTKGKQIAMNLVPPARSGATALDVGCREGIQTHWLEQRGYRVTSIDKEPLYARAQRVDIECGLPFPDEQFDLLWCSEVIEHLYDVPGALSEFRRVLKPGGVMVLTTPCSYFWLMRCAGWFGLTPARLQNPDHKQFFALSDIKRLFPRASIYGYFPYMLVKFTLSRSVGFLSPTFVIAETKTNAS
jgi:SAM-dependent methyltransferase